MSTDRSPDPATATQAWRESVWFRRLSFVCGGLAIVLWFGFLAAARYFFLPFLMSVLAARVLSGCYQLALDRAGVEMKHQWTLGRRYPMIADDYLREQHFRNVFWRPAYRPPDWKSPPPPPVVASIAAQGWYIDPTGRHEQRWFSQGEPTALVKDGTIEGHDPPPVSTG